MSNREEVDRIVKRSEQVTDQLWYVDADDFARLAGLAQAAADACDGYGSGRLWSAEVIDQLGFTVRQVLK